MALTITMAEGDDVYVIGTDDVPHRFVLDELFADEGFTLVRLDAGGDTDGSFIEVGPEKAEEILPEVFVSDGKRELSDKARVVFNAPREIDIFRGVVYRERQAQGLEV